MKNTSVTIIVSHLFTSISAQCAENKSYIIALRFNVQEAIQINQSNSQIFNNTFVQGL
jgi:hypothetical protein